MRITARLDEDYEHKLKTIQQKTHLNTTEIIKQALDLMYEKTKLTGWDKNQKLIEMLAGISVGPKDLSVNYKDDLLEGLKEKHGIK